MAADIDQHGKADKMVKDAQEAFHEIYVREQGKIYAYIATLLPRRQHAEEVFANVSLVLWKKFDLFDANREFMPWARAIAYNEVRNYRRKRHHGDLTLSDDVLAALADTRESNEDLLQLRGEALKECMQGLVADERELIEKYYLGEENAKTLAEEYQTTAAAIYMRTHRIRQFLHECVDHRVALEQ